MRRTENSTGNLTPTRYLPCKDGCEYKLKCGLFLANRFCKIAIERFAFRQVSAHELAPEFRITPHNESEVEINFGKYYGVPKGIISIPGERRIIKNGDIYKPSF